MPEGGAIAGGLSRVDIGIADQIVGQQGCVVVDHDVAGEQLPASLGGGGTSGNEHQLHCLVGRHIEIRLADGAAGEEAVRHRVVEIERTGGQDQSKRLAAWCVGCSTGRWDGPDRDRSRWPADRAARIFSTLVVLMIEPNTPLTAEP